MRQRALPEMSLFAPNGERKYLTSLERQRFFRAAGRAEPEVRLFCELLGVSGARISEVLALTLAAIDFDCRAANFRTLKRRRANVIRQVPLPDALLLELDRFFGIRRRQHDPDLAGLRLWSWSRTTAWRRVKTVMAMARILGRCAMPKGLRHGFGVRAFQANVPPHLVQRWLGHASLRTTAIYADVLGAEERDFARRMWVN